MQEYFYYPAKIIDLTNILITIPDFLAFINNS